MNSLRLPRNQTRLVLTGWKPGLNTMQLIRLLSYAANYRLKDAKDAVERMVAGSAIKLSFDSRESAWQFSAQAEKFGAICRTDADYAEQTQISQNNRGLRGTAADYTRSDGQ